MSSKQSIALEAAARQASDAARVLQARQQESKKADAPEPVKAPEESREPEARRDPRGEVTRVTARNPARDAAILTLDVGFICLFVVIDPTD